MSSYVVLSGCLYFLGSLTLSQFLSCRPLFYSHQSELPASLETLILHKLDKQESIELFSLVVVQKAAATGIQ